MEVLTTLIASLSGASVILTAFAHFFGKIWADKIAQQTMARFNQELEIVRSRNTLALEDLKIRANLEIKDREQFSGISLEFYQSFFKSRVETYLILLRIKNDYFKNMHEDFFTELTEEWMSVYCNTFDELKNTVLENQLYVSNDLDIKFNSFRVEAASYLKEATIAEGEAIGHGADERYAAEEIRRPILERFYNDTHELMNDVLQQIEDDVRKLRARIEIDRTQ
ncbi:hypothetical protein [Aeromonas hydrophila]|uniref:hypothetical protein n=1 Tax=Aeromonas hydrophila TaxID=644 RepID=UPI000AA0A4C5|nr:hypothetical protein [Aeromonas hydrophila]